MKSISRYLFLVIYFFATSSAIAGTYAQELVSRIQVQNPQWSGINISTLPTKDKASVVLAGTSDEFMVKLAYSEFDDLISHKSDFKVWSSGGFQALTVILRDVVSNDVGAITFFTSNRTLFDSSSSIDFVLKMQKLISRRVLNLVSLSDPYPYVSGARTQSFEQNVIDRFVERDSSIAILAIRGFQQPNNELVLLGSTFGRHGKKADDDDLKVLKATEPITGVFSAGKRFGADIPLTSKNGELLGTMNVGYLVDSNYDIEKLKRKALILRDEILIELEGKSEKN